MAGLRSILLVLSVGLGLAIRVKNCARAPVDSSWEGACYKLTVDEVESLIENWQGLPQTLLGEDAHFRIRSVKNNIVALDGSMAAFNFTLHQDMAALDSKGALEYHELDNFGVMNEFSAYMKFCSGRQLQLELKNDLWETRGPVVLLTPDPSACPAAVGIPESDSSFTFNAQKGFTPYKNTSYEEGVAAVAVPCEEAAFDSSWVGQCWHPDPKPLRENRVRLQAYSATSGIAAFDYFDGHSKSRFTFYQHLKIGDSKHKVKHGRTHSFMKMCKNRRVELNLGGTKEHVAIELVPNLDCSSMD